MADSLTALRSTSVIPDGTAITTRGGTNFVERETLLMKYRSMASVISKSAITPSFIGLRAVMFPGVRPNIFLASSPTALTFRESVYTATTLGSRSTMPLSFT